MKTPDSFWHACVHSVPHSATLSSSQAVVTGLLGVPASQVAMGRSHTCVLTQHGTVFTFGNNTYGQCGRNFVPPKEDVGGICTVHRRLCIIHRLLTVVSQQVFFTYAQTVDMY